MRANHRVAVIIPALNEASAIGHVVRDIPAWVDDIIVVDNGSTDGTGHVAAQAGARVVAEPRRGYGAACLRGIRAAGNADIIVFMDGDRSDRPGEMHRLVDPIVRGEADLVIGSRTRGRCERGALTPHARFGNALACCLMRCLWGARYTDLGPFRAIRRDALQRLAMADQGFGWTVEMQIKAARLGLRTQEVPVTYRRRIGCSKISGTLRGTLAAGTKILAVIARAALTVDRATRLPAEALILFARTPQPGRVKTRLIPALGAAQAARLHEAMALWTFDLARQWVRQRGAALEVRYTGGPPESARSLFGRRARLVEQGAGDLGDRLERACASAFRAGAARIAFIGTDCPHLRPEHLTRAFDALRTAGAVIGPARDGGFYLLGLARPVAGLFDRVPWGTSDVARIMLQRLHATGLAVHHLPLLDDLDRPEDVPAWERLCDAEQTPPDLSLIIPTFNEAEYLPRTLEALGTHPGVEVIVVDAGSTDATLSTARRAGARCILAPRGRAVQMNTGASAARGDTLVFLHADTRIAPAALYEIREVMRQPRVAGGALRLGIDATGVLRHALRFVEAGAELRARIARLPYGDQAIFVRASIFRTLGGFADHPIAEDLDFARRLRRAGATVILSPRVQTSARRWERHGLVRTTLANWAVSAGFALGVGPDRLRAVYDRLMSAPARPAPPPGAPAPHTQQLPLLKSHQGSPSSR